jgi:hypothetical protein
MGWVCDTHRRIKNACRILVGKAHEKIRLEKPRNRWDWNIILDFIETG